MKKTLRVIMPFSQNNKLSLFFTIFLALLFLAANSVLCKLAFSNNGIDPFSFTTLRLASGALVLLFLVKRSSTSQTISYKSSLFSSFMLFTYALAFSYSYVLIDTGVGALILFGVVQVVMISYAFLKKQALSRFKTVGALIAFIGLFYLLLPTQDSNISLLGALLMALSGVAWGVYSIVGKNTSFPLLQTSANFSLSLLFVVVFSVVLSLNLHVSKEALFYAILSGGITSGVGYVLWYQVVKKIETSTASIIQLIVPVLATLGGVLLLNEELTWHIISAAVIILSGVALSSIKKTQTI